jgi:LysR family transcriptional regulator, glycine cleavage system transcriptional activator
MLRAFEAVGRSSGIRSAARVLEVDHTVVSRHIRALEAWAGVRLVSRTTGGGITLTPEGARYHARISAALAEMNDAASELRSRNSGRRLVVWCVPGLAVQWLIARLPHFPSGNAIELHPTDRSPDFGRFEADADIRYVFGNADYHKVVATKGVRCAEIARPPIVAVASPACAALPENVRQAADLLNAPLLHEESDAQWRSWFSAHGVSVTPDSLQGPRLWHAHLALEAARCGHGVALANRFLIQNDLASGRLVQVAPRLDSREVALGTYVFAARSDCWQSAAIVRFRRWLKIAATDGSG